MYVIEVAHSVSDQFLFMQETTKLETNQAAPGRPWVILVVDDEQAVHDVTQLVLKSFEFDGRPLKILTAMSGIEARAIISHRNDISLILLDVVMETDNSGLELVKFIRDELHNRYTRIILRTGQPSQAPEEEVIRMYDINDYKEKADLTRTKLRTALFTALRSYRDICTIADSVKGLTRVIKAINTVAEADSLRVFASAVLAQITQLLNIDDAAIYVAGISPYAEKTDQGKQIILAATGKFTDSALLSDERIPDDAKAAISLALREKKSTHNEVCYVGFHETTHGFGSVLYLYHNRTLTELETHLFEIYSASVAITYETLISKEEIEESERELSYIVGEAVECRSKETSSHVRRVGLISGFLARAYGIDEKDCETIELSAPLHDVGKVGIPDHILNKPGRLNIEEWKEMQTHAQIGADLLNKSTRHILRMGAIIAAQHHENWDGNGYPRGLAGEDIHITGRITALADVSDALLSARCYKPAWKESDAIALIQKQSGKKFQPELVDLFMENIDEIRLIRAQHPDL